MTGRRDTAGIPVGPGHLVGILRHPLHPSILRAAPHKDIPFRPIFWLFGAFILACGTTHLMEATIVWHPVYRLAGVIELLAPSCPGEQVVALVPTIPKALAMRTPTNWSGRSQPANRPEDALERANAELETRYGTDCGIGTGNPPCGRFSGVKRSVRTNWRPFCRATPTPIWIAHDRSAIASRATPPPSRCSACPKGRTSRPRRPTMIRASGASENTEATPRFPRTSCRWPRAARGELVSGAEVKFVFDKRGRVRYIYGNAVPLQAWTAACVAVSPLSQT